MLGDVREGDWKAENQSFVGKLLLESAFMSDTIKEMEANEGDHHTEEARKADNKDSSGNKQKTTPLSGISQEALQTFENNMNSDGDGDGDSFLLKEVATNDEIDSKGSDDSTEDTVVGLTYQQSIDVCLSEKYKQDHNYGRRSGSVQKNDGESGEKFPVIGGLASYIGGEVSKVPVGRHSGDANLGHSSRSQNYETHYRKVSGIDPRTSGGIYSAAVGGYPANQMRRQVFINKRDELSVTSTGQVFSRQTPITPTSAQNYLALRRGLGVTQISANNQSDILFRSRHFVSSGGVITPSAPTNKGVLRPAHPLVPAISVYQGMRQIIPTSRSISAKTPAYATAVNVTGADSERRVTGVGLAPFLVPSRRPRPVIRSRARASREPNKGTVEKPVVTDPEIDNTVHVGEQSDIIITSRQRLPKSKAGNSGAVNQQNIAAEPLEPCHVSRLQHTAVQCEDPNADSVVGIVVNEKSSPKNVPYSSSAVHCTGERDASSQTVSVDSHEPIYDREALNRCSGHDIEKYAEERCEESGKPQIRHSESALFHNPKKMEMDRVAQQSVAQSVVSVMGPSKRLLEIASVGTETPVLPSEDRTTCGNIPPNSAGTSKKTNHKASSVEDMSTGEEPSVLNGKKCNEALKQLVSVATHSSISGAEEETSVNGNGDGKDMEDEGDRITEAVVGIDSPLSSNSGDDWDEEYTTRCYCGLDHNDEFMIQCDTCNVWQHGKCMDIDRRRVPDIYQCEECNPRQLKFSKAQARQMQLKEMKKGKKGKATGNSSNNYVECFKYEYTRSVMAFSRKHGDTGDPAVLKALQNDDGVGVMYVTQVSMGLVSKRFYRGGEPVIYICGRISLPCECRGREKPGSIVPFVILYSELVIEENRDPISICIDARRFGSKARFARTSCRPNIKLQHFFLKGKLHIIGVAAGNIERGEEITLPFDSDYFLSRMKLVCACSADDEDDSEDCLVRNFNQSFEEKQNLVNTTVSESHIENFDTMIDPLSFINRMHVKSKLQAPNTASNRTETTPKHHSKKQCMELKVEKAQAEIKSRSVSSGSRHSPITLLSKAIAPDYSNEANADGKMETATAVTPTTEDENATNKDLLIENSVKMGLIYVKDTTNVKNLLEKALSVERSVQTEEQHEEKELMALNKECGGQPVENKIMTEKLKMDKEAELRIENVQKSGALDARSVVKQVGRPRKKRRTPVGSTAGNAADWPERTEGNEHMVASGSTTKKICHKRRGLVEESREERKVLHELALFERMHQRETKRQRHVSSTRGSGSTGSANGSPSESKTVADNAGGGKNTMSQSSSRTKNAKGRRRVLSSESVSTVAMKRSRTISEGAKLKDKSEVEQDVAGKVEAQKLEVFTDSITLSCKSSLPHEKRGIQNAGSTQQYNNTTTTCPSNEERVKDEIEPLPKRKCANHDNKSDSDMPGKASHKEIRVFFHKMVEIVDVCGVSDFALDLQTLEGVRFPSTSVHAECDKNQIKVAATPKKKMSLDEYKKRKNSKTIMDSEKISAIAIEKKTEDGEHKPTQLSHSFIPLMSAGGSAGNRTSLRLGALPDPVQLRATPTLSIDDLKRRIYRRTTPSTAVTSNTDGISPSFVVQKNVSHTSPGQCFEEGPTSHVPSSSFRREPTATVSFSKDKRLSLEERLRLLLGCGEGYADKCINFINVHMKRRCSDLVEAEIHFCSI
ncbi:unnamed protein product [Litomosoides sigmodontis]|uniref:SET domain-containing protein n=1 Tax=Litomosoides sigmodontis TaxID=42156 RepID=A0A3P6T9X9_LITSI|nr:unnamed protein product [Litomosoides sigmodontis]